MSGEFLKPKGGYRNLVAYKISTIIYDLSMEFAARHIRKGSRTRDQIEQSARSGKQNIAEGSKAAMTSAETEIKLTNVAKASLEELLLDYEDYLRQHHLLQWDKDHPRTLRLRAYVKSDRFKSNPMEFIDRMDVEESCNLCITLIYQTTYLLDKLLVKQQQMFLEQGGIREQMTRARLSYRNQTYQADRTNRTNRTNPTYPTNPPASSDKSDKSDMSD